VEGFDIAMRMHMWCFGIEACDKLPLLDGREVLLTLDNNKLVGPDRV